MLCRAPFREYLSTYCVVLDLTWRCFVDSLGSRGSCLRPYHMDETARLDLDIVLLAVLVIEVHVLVRMIRTKQRAHVYRD